MAHTPLFHLLSQALSSAEANSAAHNSTPNPIRRNLLRGAALTVASSLTTACGSNFWTCAPPVQAPVTIGASVAVVGAGLAGLMAAYRLQQAGIAVKVYEAKPRTGGRILSLREFFADGQVAELGAEFIAAHHVHMRSLVNEFGLELDDLNQYRPELTRAIYWFDGQAYSEHDLVAALRPFAARIRYDRASLGLGPEPYFDSEYATSLDQMSLAAYFDRLGLRGWLRSCLETAMVTELGAEIEDQSAINLLANLSESGSDVASTVIDQRRFKVAGGTDRIIQALVRRLGDRIETGVAVDSVSQDESGGYRLGLRRTHELSDAKATHVILATPATMLRRMKIRIELPDRTRRAINTMPYGASAKLLVGFNRRVWTGGGSASDGTSLSDEGFQSVWDGSRLQPGPSGVITSLVGGARTRELTHGPVQEQADACMASLEKLFPGISRARVGMNHARLHWPTEHWVEGSAYCPRPGDWARFRNAFSQPVGRLHFCGEHCSDVHSRTMEGACETGERAAVALLNELGVRAPVAEDGRCAANA